MKQSGRNHLPYCDATCHNTYHIATPIRHLTNMALLKTDEIVPRHKPVQWVSDCIYVQRLLCSKSVRGRLDKTIMRSFISQTLYAHNSRL